MRAKEFITELFDQPVEYTVTKTGDFPEGNFEIDNNEYTVFIKSELQFTENLLAGKLDKDALEHLKPYTEIKYGMEALNYHEISFAMVTPRGEEAYDLTYTGNQYKVFSTVIAIINNILNSRHDIKVIYFVADEPSRQKLYQRMAQRLVNYSQWKMVYQTKKRYWLLRK